MINKIISMTGIFLLLPVLVFADDYHNDLKRTVDSMLDFSIHYLMPRSKKDAHHHHISRDIRDDFKNIHSRTQWLNDRITWHISQNHDQTAIRDDYEQEKIFRELKKILEDVLSAIEHNPKADKLYDMCDSFWNRYIEDLNELMGYRRHRRGHHREHDRDDRY